MTEPYISIQEVSRYLGIKVKTLYAKVSAQEIPHYKVDRLVRFKKEEIDLWMEEKKVEPRQLDQQIDKIIKELIEPDIDVKSVMKNAIEENKGKDL